MSDRHLPNGAVTKWDALRGSVNGEDALIVTTPDGPRYSAILLGHTLLETPTHYVGTLSHTGKFWTLDWYALVESDKVMIGPNDFPWPEI